MTAVSQLVGCTTLSAHPQLAREEDAGRLVSVEQTCLRRTL